MVNQGLSQSLKQTIGLAPNIVQSLKLLAMPLDQLQNEIANIIEANPLIKLPENHEVISLESEKPLKLSDELKINSEYENFNNKNGEEDTKRQFLENSITTTISLQDYLNEQIALLDTNEENKMYLYLLVSATNDNGFIDVSIREEIPKEKRDDVFDMLYRLDPIGIGAHDAIESLIIQANVEKKLSSEDLILFEDMIENTKNLECLNQGQFEKVANYLNTDIETVIYLFEYLKSLNPHPGLKYSSEHSQYIIVDATITTNDGIVSYFLNTNNLLDIQLDNSYLDLIQSKDIDKNTKETLEKYRKEAEFLKEQLDFRKNTLERVLDILIVKQRDYFLYGPNYIKPLTQSEVASELELSNSTISRISNDKYIKTGFGNKKLKDLFSSEINGNSQSVVIEAIKDILKENEGKKRLSDQKISDLLAERNIDIKRRTVNKYRREIIEN